MRLFAALGNPGDEYAGTRHNIGRAVLSAAQKHFGLPAFREEPQLRSRISAGKIGKERAVFLLPETFVNKSGNAVAPALKRFKVKPTHLVLVHDDVDMLLGHAKLSFGKNSGGHKGVESVMRAVKTKDFWRMRIGVQKKRRVPGQDLVLQKFKLNEINLVRKAIRKSGMAIEAICRKGPERAMNGYNR